MGDLSWSSQRTALLSKERKREAVAGLLFFFELTELPISEETAF